MSRLAILTKERWINPESCTQERDIALADLKKSSDMEPTIPFYILTSNENVIKKCTSISQWYIEYTFTVAEGWLLLDIGWFVLFFSQRIYGDFR